MVVVVEVVVVMIMLMSTACCGQRVGGTAHGMQHSKSRGRGASFTRVPLTTDYV
jgi:hypothetical protein